MSGYGPDRVRQLRLLLGVLVAAAALMAAVAAVLLAGGGDAGRVLLVLVLPAVLLLGLGTLSLWLLTRESPAARPVTATAGVLGILTGLLLSRTGPGLLVGVVGILVLLVAVLPGRDPDRLPR